MQLLDSFAGSVFSAIEASPPPGSLVGLCSIQSGDYPAFGRDGTATATLAGEVAYLPRG